jgi:hypothetical protein
MKFLQVYCEARKKEVFVNLDKIILITKTDGESCVLEVEGTEQTIKVAMQAEELVRKINGEDKTAIGFRLGR